MGRRRIAQQILWFPWSLWCGLVFVVILIVGFPILFIAVSTRNNKIIRGVHFVPPIAARIALFLWGIRIEQVNRQFSAPHQQTIFISNHTSYLDGIIACAVIPNFLKFLGKGEILNWPVLGFMMKHLYVPVFRDDKQHRAWSMEQMQEKLKTGASFYICPEGTCNTTLELLTHFHTGAHRLAIENHLPIVPLTFIGPRYVFPRKGFMLKPGKVTVYWHAPIETTMLTLAETDKLVDETRTIMMDNLLKHYPIGKFPE